MKNSACFLTDDDLSLEDFVELIDHLRERPLIFFLQVMQSTTEKMPIAVLSKVFGVGAENYYH